MVFIYSYYFYYILFTSLMYVYVCVLHITDVNMLYSLNILILIY